jgi:hypothetical protein
MSRLKKHRKKNKKFIVGLVSLSTMAILTMNVSFADEDIQAKLQNWYETRTQNALEIIEGSIKAEVEVQKERLREEVQLKMKKASDEMDQFTENQEQHHIEAIRKYSDVLINEIQFSNEEEKENLVKQLSQIQKSAEQEMLNVVNIYISKPGSASSSSSGDPTTNATEQSSIENSKEDANTSDENIEDKISDTNQTVPETIDGQESKPE